MIVWTGDGKEFHELLPGAILDELAPGIPFLMAHEVRKQIYLSMSFYFYGGLANATAAQAKPQWAAWMSSRFPAAIEPASH